VRDTLVRVYRDEGGAKLLSGIQPRVMWITIGGFVFFGAYEGAKSTLTRR
jgi:solute carrier family 25 S-adenosylmethionine transporter 26